MAIYHLTAKVISRGRGQSITAAAAYRSGSALRDERYGLTHHYPRNRTAAHAEIMSPAGAPAWVLDRETLWNRVEAGERRKDAQLARAIDIGLPVELSGAQSVALVRDFAAKEFVAIAGPRRNLVEEALGVPVEITNANFWHYNFNGLLPSL